jgi:quercetin dioxygenase-like cupin family protein
MARSNYGDIKMNNIQGKVWGSTENIFKKNNVSMHRIEINKGGYCSIHKHRYKHNAFFVESGKLKIYIWKNDYDLIDTTVVTKLQMTSVAPNEYHKFEALEDTVAYEIYWSECEDSDIERKDVGGNSKS